MRRRGRSLLATLRRLIDEALPRSPEQPPDDLPPLPSNEETRRRRLRLRLHLLEKRGKGGYR